MDFTYDIDVDYLLTCEINYELTIRGFPNGGDDSKRRKCLRRLLAADLKRPGVEYVWSVFNRDTDGAEIDVSITSVSSLVESFAGNIDASYQEIRSRLNHIKGRLRRITSTDPNVEAFRNDRLVSIIALEDDLLMKVADASPTEGGPVVVESDRPIATTSGNNVSATIPIADMTEVLVDHHAPHFNLPCQQHNIKLFKWGVSFDGKQPVLDFLERIEELRIARRVSKEDLFQSAVELFCDDALRWFRTMKFNFHNWDSLVQALKSHFLPPDYDHDVLLEIYGRKQKPHEKVVNFITSMLTLMARLCVPLSEEDQVKNITRNVLPGYRQQLVLIKPKTVSQLTSILVEFEPTIVTNVEAVKLKKDLGSLASPETQSNASNTLVCWNCQGVGHISFKCDKPRTKFCFGCGKRGVTRYACSRCQGNANGGSC